MRGRMRRGTAAAIVTVVAGAVGVTGAGVAHATGVTIGVSPSTALVDGSTVQITVNGAPNTGDQGKLYIEECGNAYANGAPLPAAVDNDQDCSVIGWILAPFSATDFTMKQLGIGSGNRSCIAAAEAARPCYVFGPSGVNFGNLLPTPTVPISFAQDPTGQAAQPSPTSTTLTATGTPIATGKSQHALVQVLDDAFRPDGTVTVTQGAAIVGSGSMLDGVADVVLTPSLGLGAHTLVAHYPGDGSFVGSSSPPATMTVVGPNNVSIGDASIVNGVGGTRSMALPVVLSQPPGANTVTVPYSITGGTAQAGIDYVGLKPNTTLTFKRTATTKWVVIKLLSDTHLTGTKRIVVHLGTPSGGGGYVIRDADGTGTIDDPATGGATVNVGDVSITEGDGGGPRVAKFAVTLSAVPTHVVTVSGSVVTQLQQTATKGSKSVGDYNGRFSFTLVFLPGVGTKPGVVSKYVTAQIWPDSHDEPDETFSVELTNVVPNAAQPFSLGRSVATGVILSDE